MKLFIFQRKKKEKGNDEIIVLIIRRGEPEVIETCTDHFTVTEDHLHCFEIQAMFAFINSKCNFILYSSYYL